MLSIAERAAYRALLDCALRNEEISEHTAQAVLSEELFARFIALTVKRKESIDESYDEEEWENWRVHPEEVEQYRNALANTKKAYANAPKRLESLQRLLLTAPKKAYATNIRIKHQYKLLANGPEACWRAYNALSDDAKKWTVGRATPQAEWPPMLAEKPPLEVVLPGTEEPSAFAIRHILTPLVGDD